MRSCPARPRAIRSLRSSQLDELPGPLGGGQWITKGNHLGHANLRTATRNCPISMYVPWHAPVPWHFTVFSGARLAECQGLEWAVSCCGSDISWLNVVRAWSQQNPGRYGRSRAVLVSGWLSRMYARILVCTHRSSVTQAGSLQEPWRRRLKLRGLSGNYHTELAIPNWGFCAILRMKPAHCIALHGVK